MPPPASMNEKPLMWWSRPSPPCDIGVRPNSPPQITSVSSSMPRCFRSVISAAVGRSTSSALQRDARLHRRRDGPSRDGRAG